MGKKNSWLKKKNGQTGSGKTYTMDGYQYKKTEKGLFLP